VRHARRDLYVEVAVIGECEHTGEVPEIAHSETLRAQVSRGG
jgi:hypothetical protein